MADGAYRFDRFVLDPHDRRLRRDGVPVDLNARYLDALVLLVAERGRLVSKDRFMAEVWRGVPVTDEALTQCVRTLRRALGDDAARPRFIETTPKHGYRFIAPVVAADDVAPSSSSPQPDAVARAGRDAFLRTGRAGLIGGGVAGLIGGIVYGFAGISDAGASGGASAVLVIACLTMAVGLIGGAGVSFGVGAAAFVPGRTPGRPGAWGVAGGAAGGLFIGAVVKLIGLDAFTLLFGQSPGDITGAGEGAVLGAAVGLGVWLASGLSVRRGAAVGGLVSGAAGVAIALAGGRLMGGSLALLAERFPQSRLRLDHVGALFGTDGFGPVAQAVTAGLEGLLFGGCVVAAVMIARRTPAA